MKFLFKSVLFVFILSFTTQIAKSQINLELGFGIPTGETEELFSESYYADLQYRFTDHKAPVELLGMAGVRHMYGDIDKTATFLPLGGGIKLNALDFLSLGVQAGHAFSLEENFDDGSFYRPFVQLTINPLFIIMVSYESIADRETLENIYFGLLIEFY